MNDTFWTEIIFSYKNMNFGSYSAEFEVHIFITETATVYGYIIII